MRHGSVRLRPRQMISSLRQRNYRLFFFGQLVSVAGTWMQTVAQSFLVLELTHSGTQLGLATAARFLPMFLFGPLGGVFADRMDKRRVLYVTQTLPACWPGRSPSLVATHRSGCGSSTCWPSRSASSTCSTTRPGRASSPRWSHAATCRTR